MIEKEKQTTSISLMHSTNDLHKGQFLRTINNSTTHEGHYMFIIDKIARTRTMRPEISCHIIRKYPLLTTAPQNFAVGTKLNILEIEHKDPTKKLFKMELTINAS